MVGKAVQHPASRDLPDNEGLPQPRCRVQASSVHALLRDPKALRLESREKGRPGYHGCTQGDSVPGQRFREAGRAVASPGGATARPYAWASRVRAALTSAEAPRRRGTGPCLHLGRSSLFRRRPRRGVLHVAVDVTDLLAQGDTSARLTANSATWPTPRVPGRRISVAARTGTGCAGRLRRSPHLDLGPVRSSGRT